MLGAMIAAETGSNIQLSKRASLLHDIGKAIDSDENLGHAVTGMELARRCGEDEVVCNAIGAHHYDVEPARGSRRSSSRSRTPFRHRGREHGANPWTTT